MKTIRLQHLTTALIALFVLTILPARAQEKAVDPDTQYATELIRPGTQAPDFSLKTPEGKTVRLSQLRGKYVVIDFWASWCPDCRKDAPEFVRLSKTYKDKGFHFVGVSFDTEVKNWKAAIKKYGMNYTHVSELKKMRESDVAKAFGVKWIPSVVILDPQGKVVKSTVVIEKVKDTLADLAAGK